MVIIKHLLKRFTGFIFSLNIISLFLAFFAFFHKKIIQINLDCNVIKTIRCCDCKSCLMELNPVGARDLAIIVPCYNVEKFVRKCIDSILFQVKNSKYNIKIILINDGSTDLTLQILEEYLVYPYVELINQNNKGLSAARNAGLRKADSRFVMFVDSDDYLFNGIIEKALDTLIKFDENKLVIFSFNHKDLIGNSLVPGTKSKKKHDYLGLSGFAWGKIYSSSLFCGIGFPENVSFEDTVGPFIIFPNADYVIYNQSIGYAYRRSEISITARAQKSPSSIDTIYVTDQVLRDRRQLSMPEDSSFNSRLLKQIVCNYKRTSWVSDDAKKEIFSLCHSWIEKYINKKAPIKFKYHFLYKAIQKKDYGSYCFLCNILR